MTKKLNTAAGSHNLENATVAGATVKNHTNPAEIGGLPKQTLRYLDVVKVQGLNEGLQMVDAEDRRSHALCCAVKALPGFRDDGRASKATYLHSVVDNSVKDSKCASTRMKRTNELLTLDQKVVDPSGVEQDEREIDCVADESDDGLARTDLKIDVEVIVSTLTPVQEKACGLLMAGVLKRDIPELVGISEHEFKHKVLPSLAKAFAEFRGAVA